MSTGIGFDILVHFAPIFFEPVQIISQRIAQTGLKGSTKRLPSGFEATEKRERSCGPCKNPGYNRNSHLCPIRLQRIIQEVEARSVSTLVCTTTTVQTEVLAHVSQG